VWKRRLIEAFAIITVGDGLIEFLAPKSIRGCGWLAPRAPEGSRCGSLKSRTG
jgi:hypothetical protein